VAHSRKISDKLACEFVAALVDKGVAEHDSQWHPIVNNTMQNNHEIPMGVSQWKEHGKRFCYWIYFLGEANEQLKEKIHRTICDEHGEEY
jgi:hypothetical protein